MSTWAAPGTQAALFGAVDVTTQATPMSYLSTNSLADLQAVYGLDDMFVGTIGGSLGEVSAVCLLLGFLYLLGRKVISWHIPVSFVGDGGHPHLPLPPGKRSADLDALQRAGRGLLLGAIFMATDYVTSPISRRNRIIYGIGCGLITVFIRYFGSYSEGVCYSILCMNLCVWLLDKYLKPPPVRRGAETPFPEKGG